jgi:hypothetical protein
LGRRHKERHGATTIARGVTSHEKEGRVDEGRKGLHDGSTEGKTRRRIASTKGGAMTARGGTARAAQRWAARRRAARRRAARRRVA